MSSLSQKPHPAAEQLFASAWSACYLGAIELAATQRKIKLPAHPAVDTQIEMIRDGNSMPGAHGIVASNFQ